MSLTHPVENAETPWRGLLGGSVRTAGLVMKQTPATRSRIHAAVERLAEEYRAGADLALPVRAKLARGNAAPVI